MGRFGIDVGSQAGCRAGQVGRMRINIKMMETAEVSCMSLSLLLSGP